MWRASGGLAILLACLVSPVFAQQELRSNTKGTSIPLPITGTVIDSNHNALDTNLANLGVRFTGADTTNDVQRVESQWEYEDVSASQTDQLMGTTGAAGDLLHALKCETSAASVGKVTVKDGAGSSFTIFLAQGAAAMLDSPALDWVSVNGAWSVTTGTNTTCRVSALQEVLLDIRRAYPSKLLIGNCTESWMGLNGEMNEGRIGQSAELAPTVGQVVPNLNCYYLPATPTTTDADIQAAYTAIKPYGAWFGVHTAALSWPAIFDTLEAT